MRKLRTLAAIAVVVLGLLPVAALRHGYWKDASQLGLGLAIASMTAGFIGGLLVYSGLKGSQELTISDRGFDVGSVVVVGFLIWWLIPSDSKDSGWEGIVGAVLVGLTLIGGKVAEDWVSQRVEAKGEGWRAAWSEFASNHRWLGAVMLALFAGGSLAFGWYADELWGYGFGVLLALMAWGQAIGIDPRVGYFREVARLWKNVVSVWPSAPRVVAATGAAVLVGLASVIWMLHR